MMANRKPFKLRNVLVLYNFAQTLFSAWIFYEVGLHLSLFINTIKNKVTEDVGTFLGLTFPSLVFEPTWA